LKEQMRRRSFLKAAGLVPLASVAVASLPGLLPSLNALAQEANNGHRIYIFISASQAPKTGGGVLPRMDITGAGTFDPDAGWVKGGGNFVLFDQNSPTPKTLIASGSWEPRGFVSYDTKGLGSYGLIQPAILTVLADLPGIGSGLTLEIICNAGFAGLSTGMEEGYQLLDTPAYGSFVPLSPVLGITHLSVEGISIDRGA
jgi:hypothetical protein